MNVGKLQTLYLAYLSKREQFVLKETFSVVVYQGQLFVENDKQLEDLVNCRFPFEQQFDSVTTNPVNAEMSALAQYRLLFNAAFAKAIKTIFY